MENQSNISPLAYKIVDHLDTRIMGGDLTNDDMVYICKQILKYLNLATVAQYAKMRQVSRVWVYKSTNLISFLGQKYVINNE